MYQSVLMNTDVHEGTKLGDVGDYAGKDHPHREVADALYACGKLKLLNLGTRVAAWFFQLAHNVGEGGHTHSVGDISLKLNALAQSSIGNELGYCALVVAGYGLNNLL